MRTWLVIPALGAAASAIAAAFGATAAQAFAAGCAGAAMTGAVRALIGESPAALAGAVIAPLLAMAAIAESGGSFGAPCAALAGIAWTVAELARASRPWAPPPVVPAVLAAIFSPAAAMLIAIASLRAPPRTPWAIALPISGAVAIAFALAVGASHGSFAALWFGGDAHPIAAAALLQRSADALGPLAALAALGGLAWIARTLIAAASRGRRAAAAPNALAALAIASCVAGALLVDLRAGAVSPVTLGLAALLAGLAIGRFAGQIRLPAGQALAAATIGAMLLLPPAWTAAGHRSASTSR